MDLEASLLSVALSDSQCEQLQGILIQLNLQFTLLSVATEEDAIALLTKQQFSCVLVRENCPDNNYQSLLQWLGDWGWRVPVIVILSQEDEVREIDFIRAGAFDCLVLDKLSLKTVASSVYNAMRLQQKQEALYLSEQRCRLVLEGADDGVWDWELQKKEIYTNDRLLAMLGLPGDTQLTTMLVSQLCYSQDYPKLTKALKAHLEQGQHFRLEVRFRHVSGEYRYFLLRGKAQRDIEQHPFRLSGIMSDITERKRNEERSRFLAQTSSLLAASPASQTTLDNLAWLAVPKIADWCVIDLRKSSDFPAHLAVAHINRDKEALLRELYSNYPLYQNLHDSCTELEQICHLDACFEVSETQLAKMAQNEEHQRLLEQLQLSSYIFVPLKASDRVLGSILFAWGESRRRCTQADLSLAEDLAYRAAWAIENARLYDERQEATENLELAIAILNEQQQQLRTLQHLTNLLNQRLTNIPDLLQVMAEQVCAAIPSVNFCFISLFNRQSNQMVLTVTAGQNLGQLCLETVLTAKWSWLHQVLNTGEPYWQHQNELEEDYPASLYALAIESGQSGRLGVLTVINWQNAQAFTDKDYRLLSAVSKQAAIAIDNARLITTLEKREISLEEQNQTLAAKNEELEYQRQQIHLQNIQLQEASQIKSQFLATVSHELRTPMNAIIGFSELLLRQGVTSLDTDQCRIVNRILSNGRTLLTLINDILDFSQIEITNLKLQPQIFNLVELVMKTIEDLRSLADEKQLALIFTCNLNNPYINHDSTRLRQIIVNLLSNALKFTEHGQISLNLQELTPDQIEVRISDTGIGISKDVIDYVFEEFWQFDQTFTRKYPGTGLGLAITKSLVEIMQGTIKVESQLGQGSTFIVTLPRN